MNNRFLIAEADDGMLDAIMKIEQTSFTCPWSANSFEEAMRAEPVRVLSALDADGTVCGFACLQMIDEEAEILNIAVGPAVRRGGIGRMLIDAMLSLARDNGVRNVYLEVRRSNVPAIRLYESVGFQLIGTRKRYYTEPVEDALIMCLTLD